MFCSVFPFCSKVLGFAITQKAVSTLLFFWTRVKAKKFPDKGIIHMHY